MARARLALLLIGCAPHVATPVLDETPTFEAAPAPKDDSPSWTGKLEEVTHEYWNGCTGHNVVDIVALQQGDRLMPVIVGWFHITPTDRGYPQFLSRTDPQSRNACVTITGPVVTYAHQGYTGAPADAIEARAITPAACP